MLFNAQLQYQSWNKYIIIQVFIVKGDHANDLMTVGEISSFSDRQCHQADHLGIWHHESVAIPGAKQHVSTKLSIFSWRHNKQHQPYNAILRSRQECFNSIQDKLFKTTAWQQDGIIQTEKNNTTSLVSRWLQRQAIVALNT